MNTYMYICIQEQLNGAYVEVLVASQWLPCSSDTPAYNDSDLIYTPVGFDFVCESGVGISNVESVRLLKNHTGSTAVEDELYTVQAGDTLTIIATAYSTTWQDLCAINELNDCDVISVGQVLVYISSLSLSLSSLSIYIPIHICLDLFIRVYIHQVEATCLFIHI